MAVYITGTVLSVLFATLASRYAQQIERLGRVKRYGEKEILQFLRILSVLPLILIAAFRYQVGADYNAYRAIYMTGAANYSSDEPLFTYLVRFLNSFSLNPILFFATTSVLIYGSYQRAIYKTSSNTALSIALLVLTGEYFRAYAVIRQYLALAILLFAVPAMEEKKWKKFLLICIAAFFMHNSAIAFIGLFLLYWLHLSPFFVLTGVMIAGISGELIVKYIFPIIEKLTRFAWYFLDSSGYSESRFAMWSILLYGALLLLVCYLYYLQKGKNNVALSMLSSAVYFGLFFAVLSRFFPSSFNRMGRYADSIIVIYLPAALQVIKSKNERTMVTVGIVLCYFVLLLLLLDKGDIGVLPYSSIWQR